jgi:tetratricopeptide (TPR) repeat protein
MKIYCGVTGLAFFALSSHVIAIPTACNEGVRYAKASNYDEAINKYSICLADSTLSVSDRARALRNRALAYSEKVEFDAALKDQTLALQLELPKNAWPFVMKSRYLRELKRYDEAIAALALAEQLDEDGPGTGPGMAVRYHKGQALHLLGKFDEAIAAYSVGLTKQPTYAYAYYRRGLAFEKKGERDHAKMDFEKAVELEPNEGFEADVAAKLKEYGLKPKKTQNVRLD